ncbi:chaperone modulator CbpM [Hahella sp. SMD15-11]|uniref:Chaperone modulator CbpM n=1 Tax=Thermohahella caldifontis TaxID=3142973 RepID=A0AB39UUE8_9GAMM
MATHIVIRTTQGDEDTFTLREVCERNHVHAELVMKLVSYGIAEPRPGDRPGQWLFSTRDLARIRRALNLMHDLQVNVPGAALTLDLLDELDSLRREVARLRRLL